MIALVTFYGWGNGTGGPFGTGCSGDDPITVETCTGFWEGFTFPTNERYGPIPSDGGFEFPCPSGEPMEFPICLFYRSFLMCQYATGPSGSMGALLQVAPYRSGADLRCNVVLTLIDQEAIVGEVGRHVATADFVLVTGGYRFTCLSDTWLDVPLTICSSVGAYHGCTMPTSLDLAFAEGI